MFYKDCHVVQDKCEGVPWRREQIKRGDKRVQKERKKREEKEEKKTERKIERKKEWKDGQDKPNENL